MRGVAFDGCWSATDLSAVTFVSSSTAARVPAAFGAAAAGAGAG